MCPLLAARFGAARRLARRVGGRLPALDPCLGRARRLSRIDLLIVLDHFHFSVLHRRAVVLGLARHGVSLLLLETVGTRGPDGILGGSLAVGSDVIIVGA